MKKILVSWSGGKDSCYALQKAISNEVQTVALISMMNNSGTYTKSNGVPKEVLQRQAKNLHLPLILVPTTWEQYEEKLLKALISARKKFDAEYCIFGDIDIKEHKKFEEEISQKAGLKALLPLWGYDRNKLAHEVIKSGIKAKISVVRKNIMSERYLGSDYSKEIFSYLKKNNIDLLGENGEFHTLVYNSPLFQNEIIIEQANTYDIQDCKSISFKLK